MKTGGNPRLDTLELIARGLNSEIALIPEEKLSAVLAVLKADDTALTTEPFARKSEFNNAAEE